MYIRLHNLCTYVIYEDYFEIRSSNISGLSFRFKGFTTKSASLLLQLLHSGIEELSAAEFLSYSVSCDKNKIIQLLLFLESKGFLVKRSLITSHKPEDTLYDRQIRFFDSFENENSEGKYFNKQLQNRKIVIVGLGAYGTWLALHCARLGIKQITGIDFDTVELSNLHRQILYTKDDIGFPKATACSKILTSVDQSIKYRGYCKKIENEDDLIPFLENADLVFNAFGYYPENAAKNAISGFITTASIKTKTPMLCLSTNWLGPFYVPKRSACYFCAVKNPEIEPILQNHKKNVRIEKRAFCPILAMTCSIAAIEAARYLSGIDQPSTLKGLLAIDPFRIEKSKFIPIDPLESCSYCH
jgi:hypothetical protein